MALAEPLSTRIGSRIAVVNARIGRWVARAVAIGRASARFFGTSSPMSMVRIVLRTRLVASAIGPTAPSGTPAASSGSRSSSAIAGSARKPMPRLVDRDADLRARELGRQRPQGPLHAGRGGVALGRGLVDLRLGRR